MFEFTTSFQLNWAIQNLYISPFYAYVFQLTQIGTLGLCIYVFVAAVLMTSLVVPNNFPMCGLRKEQLSRTYSLLGCFFFLFFFNNTTIEQ